MAHVAGDRHFYIGAAAVVAAAALAYTPLARGEWAFVDEWDDDYNFGKETMYHALDGEHLYRMFTAVRINVYEPFGWLFKAFVFAGFGNDPAAYRWATLALHAGDLAAARRFGPSVYLQARRCRDFFRRCYTRCFF